MSVMTKDISTKTLARTAGILYLVIIAAGIFAEFFVRGGLVIPGDAVQTAANIKEGNMLFRLGITADMIMILADVAIGVFFYFLLKPVNKTLALLAAFFRLAQAATLGVNLLNLLIVQHLLGGGEFLTSLGAGQVPAMVTLFLNAHSSGYLLGLVFFGVHCLILGYLMYKSGFIPKILGALILIAAFGYLLDSFANFLLPSYKEYQDIFMTLVFLPAFIGELALALWLVIKGVKE